MSTLAGLVASYLRDFWRQKVSLQKLFTCAAEVFIIQNKTPLCRLPCFWYNILNSSLLSQRVCRLRITTENFRDVSTTVETRARILALTGKKKKLKTILGRGFSSGHLKVDWMGFFRAKRPRLTAVYHFVQLKGSSCMSSRQLIASYELGSRELTCVAFSAEVSGR